MKRLIASNFVFLTLLCLKPQITTLTSSTTIIHNENHLKKINLTHGNFEDVEKYFNFKTEQENKY